MRLHSILLSHDLIQIAYYDLNVDERITCTGYDNCKTLLIQIIQDPTDWNLGIFTIEFLENIVHFF